MAKASGVPRPSPRFLKFRRFNKMKSPKTLKYPFQIGVALSEEAATYLKAAAKADDRTYHVAHLYVQQHWDEITSGDVVDVEFVLGETDAPKESEIVEAL